MPTPDRSAGPSGPLRRWRPTHRMHPARPVGRRPFVSWLLACLLLLAGGPVAGPPGASGWFGGTAAHADDGDGGDGDGDDGGGGGGVGPGAAGGEGGGADVDPARPPVRPLLLFSGGVAAPQELVAMGLAGRDLARLRQQGFTVLASQRSRLLGAVATRLAVPPTMSAERGLDLLRRTAPRAVADLNHYYRTQQAAARAPVPAEPCAGDTSADAAAGCWPRRLIAWPDDGPGCRRQVVVGMVDTAIDTAHPALRGQRVQTLALPGRGERPPSDADHGTAVASILVGRRDGPVPGLLPQARLLAVDAFHRGSAGLLRGSEDRMDAYDLLAALDLLVQRGARVVNLSFAGADNMLVQRGVVGASRRGVLLVAAVGNAGPRSAALYPAAYPQVLGVTAVGAAAAVYRRALQGRQVALAAPGVDVWSAGSDGAVALRSGTSMASPHVSAAAALWLGRGLGAPQVQQRLRSEARDLGERGPDPVFGHGLLQAGRACG